jgi:Phosphatidylinositol transfer protein
MFRREAYLLLCHFFRKESSKPVVTAYKLVTVEAPIWGLGERLEDMLVSVS